jgi:hypothetical protein
MKEVLAIIVIVFSINVNAQHRLSDSMENHIQMGMMQKSSHGYGALFIGFHEAWVKNIADFMQHKGYTVKVPNAFFRHGVVYKLKNKESDGRIKIFGYHNPKTNQVLYMRITGDSDELIYLYSSYWGAKGAVEKLKRNAIDSLSYGSDKVIFDWTGRKAVIKVLRHPHYYHSVYLPD